jgi:hypothetical protein
LKSIDPCLFLINGIFGPQNFACLFLINGIFGPQNFACLFLINGIFGPQNSAMPLSTGKKTFFSTLNLMILQMVWNECVRFGGYVNIQVSDKILQLEVLKKALILHYSTCFKRGCCGNFELNVASSV